MLLCIQTVFEKFVVLYTKQDLLHKITKLEKAVYAKRTWRPNGATSTLGEQYIYTFQVPTITVSALSDYAYVNPTSPASSWARTQMNTYLPPNNANYYSWIYMDSNNQIFLGIQGTNFIGDPNRGFEVSA